jgi:glucose/arabinose dehydrogenase
MRIDPAGHDGFGGGYGIPADNPFARSKDPAVHREIWAYGFRNAHRFTWDVRRSGRTMIAVDIGESNVEEINLIEPGHQYGWGARHLEGDQYIDPLIDPKVVRPATDEELAGIHLPFAAYDHEDGPAITGGYVYHGPLESLRNKYIFTDIVNGRLFYLDLANGFTDPTIYEIKIARDGVPTTIRDLARTARAHVRIGYDERHGDLYITTKDDGMVRRVTKAYRRP